uniref:HTH psq-type domain-containing protein n=1 Tax=Anopheles farauti TaxID=69004 RepID=A0A182QXV0_9DIPT
MFQAAVSTEKLFVYNSAFRVCARKATTGSKKVVFFTEKCSEKVNSMSEDSNGVRRRKSANSYTKRDLKNAMNLIVERGVSIRRAAFVCNVPRTTLSTYLKSITHGKITKLLPQEEQALFQWMTDCCKQGFTIKKRNVETAADALVQKNASTRSHPFQDSEFGRRCYQKFVKKWLSIDRVKDRKHLGTILDWYLHIENYLVETNLFEILNNPARVFLSDELRFRERVEMQESVRTVLKKMTMLYTVSAAGEHLSPLLVYPYRRDVPEEIVKAAPKNCAIVAHEYGQVTPKTFAAYLDKVVDKFVMTNNIPKPVLMFVDESQVDLTLYLHNTCKRLGVILLGLSTAQVMKPTGNMFNDICTGWEQELPKWESESGRSFTLADCAGLMQPINQRYIKRSVLIKDFADSNLCPWNRPMRVGAEGATSVGASTVEETEDMGEPDDDEDDDNEIENFLENVDGWSDGEEGDENDFDDDDDFIDEIGDAMDDDVELDGQHKLEKESLEKHRDVIEKTTATVADEKQLSTEVVPATSTPVLENKSSAETEKANGTGIDTDTKESSKTENPAAEMASNSEDENEGPPDDIDISINFIDFKRAIGSEMTEKFERKLEIENRLTLANHAENVLYDIYRQFRCDIVTDSDDDYDIVEVGDD